MKDCKSCKSPMCDMRGRLEDMPEIICYGYDPKTNGDLINGMSNYEKAELIAGLIATEHARVSAGLGHELTATQIGAISHTWFCTLYGWLNQPAEVET